MGALQAHAGDADRSQNQTIEDALASLEKCQMILDQEEASPHIGARLQEVIELVRDEISSRTS